MLGRHVREGSFLIRLDGDPYGYGDTPSTPPPFPDNKQF